MWRQGQNVPGRRHRSRYGGAVGVFLRHPHAVAVDGARTRGDVVTARPMVRIQVGERRRIQVIVPEGAGEVAVAAETDGNPGWATAALGMINVLCAQRLPVVPEGDGE